MLVFGSWWQSPKLWLTFTFPYLYISHTRQQYILLSPDIDFLTFVNQKIMTWTIFYFFKLLLLLLLLLLIYFVSSLPKEKLSSLCYPSQINSPSSGKGLIRRQNPRFKLSSEINSMVSDASSSSNFETAWGMSCNGEWNWCTGRCPPGSGLSASIDSSSSSFSSLSKSGRRDSTKTGKIYCASGLALGVSDEIDCCCSGLIAASSMKTGLLISTNQSSNNFGCRMTLFVGYCLMGLGQNITGWISVSVSGVGLGSYTVEWTWCKGKVCRGSGLGLSETRPSGLIDAAALTKEIYSLIHTNHSSNAWSFKTASGVRNRFIGLGQKKLCIPGADGWGGSNSGGWNGKSRRGSGLFDSLDSSSCASSSYSSGSKWWRGESRHGSGLSASTWWNSIFLLMGNDKRLPPPHYRNAETLGPMGKLDDRLFCEYFARLPNKGLRNRGYTRVVRGDNRTTQQKVSGRRHS